MRPRGVVLVAVLLVTALVTMLAASLMFCMRAEVGASTAKMRGEQAYDAAMSGLVRASVVVRQSVADPRIWYDNPDIFQNQLVADDGANQWYFSVYGDDPSEQPTSVRFGVTDEASKINVNSAGPEVLTNLKNMTAELVDCLIDYRDADSDTRAEGAEQDYYDQLTVPYVVPNGPLATLEELLLVKGFNGQIVFGEDANMNGLLDPSEDDGDQSFPPDNRDGRLDKGLRGVATAYSSEPNTDRSGRRRISLNGDPNLLKGAGLSDKTVEFIRLYRAEGNTFKHPSELLEMRYTLKQEHKESRNLKVGAAIESEVGGEQLATVLDRLTVLPPDSRKPVLGLVNVNTAPAEVLAALPGMDANLAQQIVDARRNLEPEVKSSIAWLFTQNLVEAAAFKTIAPYLTTRSYQFSLRCVGFGVPCGRYCVIDAVFDMTSGTPRIVYLRDVSRLGLPFALDTSVTERSR